MIAADIATELFEELAPDDVTVPVITYWLLTNLGKLNNLLATEFAPVSAEIYPELTENQKDIYKLLYSINYYKRQANKNLGAAASTSIESWKEGDRQAKRFNKNEIAKSYLAMVRQLNDELEQQLISYKLNQANVEQFIVENPLLVDIDCAPYPYPRRCELD